MSIFDRLNLIEITIISSNIIVRSSPLRLFALVQYSEPGKPYSDQEELLRLPSFKKMSIYDILDLTEISTIIIIMTFICLGSIQCTRFKVTFVLARRPYETNRLNRPPRKKITNFNIRAACMRIGLLRNISVKTLTFFLLLLLKLGTDK